MSYKDFRRPEFVKELDKIINNITSLRNKNNVSNPNVLTSSEREYIKDVDDNLKTLQNNLTDKKMTYVQTK